MADIEQQARELLAVVYESNGRLGMAALVRNGHIPASDPTITALITALRATPVRGIDLDAMHVIACRAWDQHYASCRITTVKGSLRKVCEALINGSPSG